jgi:hypothetical protein
LTTGDAELHLVNGQVNVRLPAYGFVIGELRTSANYPFAVVEKEPDAAARHVVEKEIA